MACWSSANAASNDSAAIAGSAVGVSRRSSRWLLVGRARSSAVDARGDEHTKPDPDDRPRSPRRRRSQGPRPAPSAARRRSRRSRRRRRGGEAAWPAAPRPVADDRLVGGAADDRVAALERRLRAEDREGGAGSPSVERAAATRRTRARQHGRALEATAFAASRPGRSGEPAASARRRRRPPSSPSTARVARSSSSPTRSREAASWAAGSSRSRARRSATTSRDARPEAAARRRRRSARPTAPNAVCHSARSGTTSSAAADGVGARTSAAKSASVTSTSWPTPQTTGSAVGDDRPDDALVVERPEVLEQPPPRARIVTLRSVVGPARRARLLRDPALEPAERRDDARRRRRRPGPGTATRTTRVSGQRRARTWQMSRQTTPVGLVIDRDRRRARRQRPLPRRVEQALRPRAAP